VAEESAWALQQLSSFVGAVSSVRDPRCAVTIAVERAAEALSADVAAILHTDGGITRSDAPGDTAAEALRTLITPPGRAGAGYGNASCGALALPQPDRGHVAWVDLDDEDFGTLAVMRSGARPFEDEEREVLQAIGRTLVLAVRLLGTLADERALREESEEQARENADLADELQQRQDVLEHLLDIQRAASSRAPLQETLDRITQSVADLLDADLVGLRLLDGHDIERLRLVSGGGVDSDLVAVAKRSMTEAGIAAEAIREQRLVVRHNYAEASDAIGQFVEIGVRFAMAAPVIVDDEVVGCLSVASRSRGMGYGPDGQQVLRVFAEQASLALSGAQTRERLDQAFCDPLTGLPNRTLFLDRLEHALARNERTPVDLCVLFIDLDRFKYVNDSLGHAVGDQLLAVMAERVVRCMRDADTVARLGGDEVAILLEDVSLLQAREVAERLLAVLREPVVLHDREIVVSASIGIAQTAAASIDAGELLRNADVAMYRAKHVGGDQVRVYEPGLHAAVLLRLELEGDLRRALRNDEFRLVYQPVVELSSLRIVGVEALLRWDHARRGVVPPESFIPVAEETGLIVDIGRWVLHTACMQATRWQVLLGGCDFHVSVNISARQLQQAMFVDEVDRALREAALPPEQLLLEITETALMRDPDTAADTLQALKRLGMRIALDDFGTGYSSLNYLRQFPVDVMKIDRSFVNDVAGQQHALAQTMVGLARNLQLDTVAEGIETEEQLAALREIGCVHGQGYYFSRPMASGDLTDVLLRGTFAPVA